MVDEREGGAGRGAFPVQEEAGFLDEMGVYVMCTGFGSSLEKRLYSLLLLTENLVPCGLSACCCRRV